MLYFKYDDDYDDDDYDDDDDDNNNNHNNNITCVRNVSSKGKGRPMACLCRHKWEAVAYFQPIRNPCASRGEWRGHDHSPLD
jgi:hypothetical protein